MYITIIYMLKKPLVFEWDKDNQEKNVKKHNVENSETEEVFFNDPVILPDRTHSEAEERYYAFGVTNKGRYLLVSFTLRGNKEDQVRPIMSRDQTKKERLYYHKEKVR